MKVKKIIITLIIINILLIGIIYNFIIKDYLNNEKIIVKAMTEGEYEDNITALNQSHTDYANYIQESKIKIASALTDMGVTTSSQETLEEMASNIRNIKGLDFENYAFIKTIGENQSYEITAKGIYMVSHGTGNGNQGVTPTSTGTLLYEDKTSYPNYASTYRNNFIFFECEVGDTISYRGHYNCNIIRLM